MSDGPDDIADVAVGATTSGVAPSSGGGESIDTSGLEAAPTPGEIMIEQAPTSSDSSQRLYEQFNSDALASANDPTINSYSVELKTSQIFAGQDDPHSEDVREGSKSEEREKKTRERLDQLADHLERMEEIQARQKDWMERDHQVGGMHMSGRDLEGFLRVMGDPKKREQISQKLREQGMSDKDVKKAEKEAQEFARLKQIEKMRDLTDDEKKRLEEINKSETFKKYSETVAKENGITLSNSSKLKEATNSNSTTDRESTIKSLSSYAKINAQQELEAKESTNEARGFGVVASAKEVSTTLAKAPELSQAFAQSNVVKLAAQSSPASDFGDSLEKTAKSTKSAQVAKAQDTFSASL